MPLWLPSLLLFLLLRRLRWGQRARAGRLLPLFRSPQSLLWPPLFQVRQSPRLFRLLRWRPLPPWRQACQSGPKGRLGPSRLLCQLDLQAPAVPVRLVHLEHLGTPVGLPGLVLPPDPVDRCRPWHPLRPWALRDLAGPACPSSSDAVPCCFLRFGPRRRRQSSRRAGSPTGPR